MIKRNGILALSDTNYDYYELVQDFGQVLKKGSIFVHDPDDNMYGSLAKGCLKLCWTPDGNCYSGLCANTVFLHFKFATDTTLFKEVKPQVSDMLMRKLKSIEDELKEIKKELRESVR